MSTSAQSVASGDLEKKASLARGVTTRAQFIKLFLNFGSTAILARLLSPSDYGLIAMVALAFGILDSFKDFGLSAATIQRAELSSAQVNNLFWLNMGVGLGLGVLFAATAPLLAWFYHEPRLLTLVPVFSTCFLLQASSVQHMALRKRSLNFQSVARIEISSLAGGFACAIAAAAYGWGYWSLVVQRIVQATIAVIGAWYKSDFFPSFPQKRAGTRGLIRFGANLAGFNVLNFAAKSFDTMLVAKISGPFDAGLYSRAYQLLFLPINQINAPLGAVAIPVLSRLVKEPVRFAAYFLETMGTLISLTVPIVGFCMLYSKQIISILLGKEWLPAADIFVIFGLAGLLQPLASGSGWIMVSTGDTGRMFKWRLLTFWVAPLLTVVFGLWGGIKGVAYGKLVATLVLSIGCVVFVTKGTCIKPMALIRCVGRPILAMGGASAILILFPANIHWIPVLGIGYVILYFAILCGLERSLHPLRSVFELIGRRRVVPPSQPKSAAPEQTFTPAGSPGLEVKSDSMTVKVTA